MGGGVYVRAFPDSGALPDRWAARLLFDPTVVDRGYGWVFPKRDHLNVGVFTQSELHRGLTEVLHRFLAERGLLDWRTEGPLAFPIPVGATRGRPGRGRVLLVGDAAGLVNPITGEGISSAVLSGLRAAEAVATAFASTESASSKSALEIYARSVQREVIPMTDGSRRVGGLFYGLGPRTIRFVARTPVLRALVAPAWRAATHAGDKLSLEVVTHERKATPPGGVS
jgi:flavin-dependent dehydrogenase